MGRICLHGELDLTLFILIYQVKGVLEVNLTHKSVYQQYQ